MNRRIALWFLATLVLALIVALSAPGTLAEQPKPAAKAASPAPKAATPPAGQPAAPDDSTVEKILRQQEALATGQVFEYDPSGRRDPFRSLFETLRGAGAKRPAGAAGMLVAELDLIGVVRDANDGDMAMVRGSDNRGYFLRVGDRVFDGTVIGVDPRQGTVTIRQQVDDPRMIKPYRDVVKRLVLQESVNAQMEEDQDEESGDE